MTEKEAKSDLKGPLEITLSFQYGARDVGDFCQSDIEIKNRGSGVLEKDMLVKIKQVLENTADYCSHSSTTLNIVSDDMRNKAIEIGKEYGYCVYFEDDEMEYVGDSDSDHGPLANGIIENEYDMADMEYEMGYEMEYESEPDSNIGTLSGDFEKRGIITIDSKCLEKLLNE